MKNSADSDKSIEIICSSGINLGAYKWDFLTKVFSVS